MVTGVRIGRVESIIPIRGRLGAARRKRRTPVGLSFAPTRIVDGLDGLEVETASVSAVEWLPTAPI